MKQQLTLLKGDKEKSQLDQSKCSQEQERLGERTAELENFLQEFSEDSRNLLSEVENLKEELQESERDIE